jgi:hypothetical protein
MWAAEVLPRKMRHLRTQQPLNYADPRLCNHPLHVCTPYEMVYGVKPNLTDLCAFSTPCTINIVKLAVKLWKLDDHATMHIFIWYKYPVHW